MEIIEGDLYLKEVRELIKAYIKELNRNLDFQDLDDELEHLEKKYTKPYGRIIVAIIHNKVIGCVAYYKHSDFRCEMKRLFVLPEYRRYKVGQRLIDKIIQCAKEEGMKEMVLDTIVPLQSAIHLYKKNGFIETDAYYDNPMNDVIYMKLDL